jgi:hypothetical protein
MEGIVWKLKDSVDSQVRPLYTSKPKGTIPAACAGAWQESLEEEKILTLVLVRPKIHMEESEGRSEPTTVTS